MIDRKSRLSQLDLFLPVPPRPLAPKYQLTVNGSTHYWTGRGRLPLVFEQYLARHQPRGSREQLLKSLEIKEVAA